MTGLFRGDAARFYHVGHEAVIAGNLLKASVMQQVGAGVAYMGDGDTALLYDGSGHSGAHALEARLAGFFDDRHVGVDDCLAKVLYVCAGGSELLQSLDGGFGSDIACRMTAHAVSYGEERR